MLKRWATWPQGIRWLVGIAVVVLALAIVWALIVPLADLLAHHDVGSVTGSLHETALDNARGRLLTLGAGLLAAGVLVFTALNFNLLRRNSEQTDQWQRRTYELTEQGQVTDRYTKAIEQLGSEKLDVRIGGIYALERVARDSARDHPTVMEVLTAFIREHSQEQWPPSDHPVSRGQERSTRPDVQAALTVVARRDPAPDFGSIDLTGAVLRRADLVGANLTGPLVRGTIHSGAKAVAADLDGKVRFGAKLAGADLSDANLTGALLTCANLSGANLAGAHLRGADLSDVDLSDARWPRSAPVPQGWRLDPIFGRLWRTRAGSSPTETV
jgi:hypothetical protein